MQFLITRRNSTFFWLTPIRPLFWRILIVAAVLSISAFLSYKVAPSRQILVLGLLIVSGTGVLLIRYSSLGVLLLLCSIAVPINGPSNSNLTMVVAAGLIGLWLLDMVVAQRAIKVVKSITLLPLLALLAVATIAFGTGQLVWYPLGQHAPLGAQVAGLSLFYLSAGVFLVVAHQIRDLRWLNWSVWLFLVMGAFVVVGRILPDSVGRLTMQFFGVQALGSLFWVWLLTWAVSQAVLNVQLSNGWRIVLGGLAAATVYVMLTQMWEWNSGWMPAMVSILTIILMNQPRLGIGLLFVGALFAAIKFSDVISALLVGDNAYSYSTRLEAWAIVWDIVKISPWVGLGPANYYWYTLLFGIRGYYVSFNSHQQYMDLLAQTGVLGLLCFLWFFVAAGRLVWRLRRQAEPGFMRAYLDGALGGITGTLVASIFGDWVIPFFYNITLGGFRASMLSWLFLGGVVVIEQILQGKESADASEEDTARFFARRSKEPGSSLCGESPN